MRSDTSRPSVLLDTSVISGMAKRDLPAEELAAAARIMAWARSSAITVAATTVSRDELDRIPTPNRGPHDAVYGALREMVTRSGVTWIDPATLSVATNPVYAQLRAVLPDEADARIMAIGEEHGFDFVVTFDQRTILNRREAVRSICTIEPLRPTEAVSAISARLVQHSA